MDELSASPRINLYERGKHTPDYSTIERLAKVLKVPAPYLYARDDDLAQLILHFGRQTMTERRRLLKGMRARRKNDGGGSA